MSRLKTSRVLSLRLWHFSVIDHQRVILGCGNFGGIGSLPELIGKGDDTATAENLLDLARDFGITRFDTANSYGGGRSEEILGQWIVKQEPAFRAKAQISTKVGNPFGCRIGKTPLAASEIKFHVQNSLRRLRLERIDALYLHEPDPLTSLEDTLAGLSDVLSRGLVDSIGLSNVSLSYLQKFIATSDHFIRSRITRVQNEFHYLNNRDRSKLIPFLRSAGISYVAFSPLAGGLLSGKYLLGQSFPDKSRLSLRSDPYREYLNPEQFKKIDELQLSAQKKGRSVAEEAFRFVLDEDGIDFAVIGPRKKEHYETLGLKCKRN